MDGYISCYYLLWAGCLNSLKTGIGPANGQENQPVKEQPPDKDKLSDCVKNLLAPYFPGHDLSGITLTKGIPFFVPLKADGFTFGQTIHINKDLWNSDLQKTIDGIVLIGHEVTHTKQFKDLGFANLGFVDKYLGSYVNNLQSFKHFSLNPLSEHEQAYANISLEKEAYAMGDKIRADLTKKFGGNNPCP
jgi:hypothetical protein